MTKRCKVTKDSRDHFWCSNFPEELFYPIKYQDGEYRHVISSLLIQEYKFLPEGYETREQAYEAGRHSGGSFIVINGEQAKTFPIPKP